MICTTRISEDAMADTQTVHPHVSGILAPVRSEDDFELKVVGRIPDCAGPRLLPQRTQSAVRPARQRTCHLRRRHDPRLLPRAEPEGGRAHYRNRWVRTPRWLAENKAGRPLFGFPAAPSDPSVADVPRGAANTNIVHHAGKLMALQEQASRSSLIRKASSAGGFMNTGGKFTAHPKMDPETGEMVWFGYFAVPSGFPI